MFIVLLSGGAGLRLWPLSNNSRSKQYIRIISDEEGTENCSMLQRVWKQLDVAGLAANSIITASQGQVEIINNQIGDINIAIEPERRDTFPAVALSCAYIKDYLGASDDDSICFIPVDPYTDCTYFERLKQLEVVLEEKSADVVLMGVVPTYPSSQFGYILPDIYSEGENYKVERFKEKPDKKIAQELIEKGALWNCGVFCTKISTVVAAVKNYHVGTSYDEMCKHYTQFPAKSFDYEILEKSSNLYVVPFSGMWKDLGTWNTLSAEMEKKYIGNSVVAVSCKNTHVINELDIATVVVGTNNLVVVSSYDGILVADKAHCDNLKEVLDTVDLSIKYEERRWGVLKTLDFSKNEEGFTLLRKIVMFGDKSSSYHFHNERDEVLAILSGRGEIIIEGVSILLNQGSAITIPRNKKHAVRAFCDMEYLETHIGKTFGDEDINRLTFDWDHIKSF